MEAHEFFIVNATICIHGVARVEFKIQDPHSMTVMTRRGWRNGDGGGDLDFELISMKIEH